eukprot:COSAG01_NODE_909_length_12785_cov_4.201876_3_plen_164_part_00
MKTGCSEVEWSSTPSVTQVYTHRGQQRFWLKGRLYACPRVSFLWSCRIAAAHAVWLRGRSVGCDSARGVQRGGAAARAAFIVFTRCWRPVVCGVAAASRGLAGRPVCAWGAQTTARRHGPRHRAAHPCVVEACVRARAPGGAATRALSHLPCLYSRSGWQQQQ